MSKMENFQLVSGALYLKVKKADSKDQSTKRKIRVVQKSKIIVITSSMKLTPLILITCLMIRISQTNSDTIFLQMKTKKGRSLFIQLLYLETNIFVILL